MSTERVGIYIDIMGYEKASSMMETLQGKLNGLNGRRNRIKIQAEIDRIKMNKAALKSQKVKIQADLSDVDRKLNRLRSRMKNLSQSIKLYAKDSPAYNRMSAQIGRLRNEINSLNGTRMNLKSNLGQVNAEIAQSEAAIQRLRTAMSMSQTGAMSLGKVWSKSASAMSHAGQAMQSAGNALTRMSSPVRFMGRMLGFGAGFAAFGKISEGISSGFQRYDIMKKYPKMMAQFSKANFTAEDSINKLNESVIGLPTGLDEIVNLAQRFTMTAGDMTKGTELAIATNNAFLASMSTDTQKYQGMMQMQDVIGGKKLNAREWQSLANSMMPAIRWMGEELGKSGKELDEWVASVQQGKVANKDFLDALVKAGTETDGRMGKIAQMAENSKDTWEAFSANVKIAFSRMTVGVIESLDEITRAATGLDLNKLLSEIAPKKIDAITASLKGWIKENPEKITNFVNSLRGVDWASLGKGFGRGIIAIADAISSVANLVKGKDLSMFGKMAAFLIPLGTFLTIGGGLLKGGRHIFALIPTIGIGLGKMMSGLGKGLKFGGLAFLGSKLTNLMTGLKNFTKLGAVTSTAAAGAKTAATKGVKIGSYMKTLAKGLAGVAAVVAVPVIVGGGVMLTVKAIKNIVKDLKEASDVFATIDTASMKALGSKIASIGGPITALAGIVGFVTALAPEAMLPALAAMEAGIGALGIMVTTIAGFAWINSALIHGTVKNLADAVEYVGDIATGINDLNGVTINTAGLDKVTESIGTAMEHLDKLQSGGSDSGTWFGNAAAKKLKKKFDNIGSIVGTLKQTAQDMQAISKVNPYSVERAGNTVSNLVEKLDKVYTQIQEDFNVTTKTDLKGSENAVGIVENIKSIVGTVKESLSDLSAIAKDNTDYRVGIGKVKSIMSQLKEMSDAFDELFAGGEPESKGTTIKTGKQGQAEKTGITKGDVDKTEAQAGWMTNITTMLEQVRGAYDAITNKETGVAKVNEKKFKAMLDKVGTIINNLGAAWRDWSADLDWFADAEEDAANMKGVEAAVTSIKNLMGTLATIGTNLNNGQYGQSIGEMKPDFSGSMGDIQTGGATSFIDMAIDNITQMMDKMRTLSETIANIPSIESLQTNMEQVQAAVAQIPDIMSTLSSLGEGDLASTEGPAFTAINNIKTFVTRLGNALNTETLAGLQEQIDTFKEAINNMIQALNTDFANVEVTINIIGDVTGDDETVQMLEDAHDDIKSARDDIKALSQSISLSFPISASLPGLEGAIARMYSAAARLRAARAVLRSAQSGAATGGLITPAGAMYYSKGGGVPNRTFPGHPKGTDTVPTWLTPGEWVTKRKATGFWGVDFMHKVNRMDVMGVLRSASAKANSVMNSSRQTIINNNIVNNYNNTNTQHVQTNNPNFAFRRSRRALGMI